MVGCVGARGDVRPIYFKIWADDISYTAHLKTLVNHFQIQYSTQQYLGKNFYLNFPGQLFMQQTNTDGPRTVQFIQLIILDINILFKVQMALLDVGQAKKCKVMNFIPHMWLVADIVPTDR